MIDRADRARRAKLKIFFGYAPGIGKTYTMLESARALSSEGVDVLVGAVETHGRYDTAALLLGLDIQQRRRVVYRGAELAEFDIEAALSRRPRVLLLDELAHVNAPGGRHPRRWQDVLDLLDAGIDVHTTLNVQEVESLNDVVAQITSIRVRETVPDAILDRADEIELVDLPPDELLQRLAEGKVYLSQQAVRAAEQLFSRGNLLALRELALRRAAERVEVDVREYRKVEGIETAWPTAERILVAVGPGPGSARLIRAACRMAAGLRARWTAVYVEGGRLAPLPSADRARLESHLRLAESLGGEVAHLAGGKVSNVLLEHARRHDVTRILVGKPTHSRWRDRLRGSILDEVVRGSGDIDVLVIAGDVEPAPVAPARSRARVLWQSYGWAAAVVALATLGAWLSRDYLAAADVVMVYLLVIALAALRFGRGPAIAAAALSVALYDVFFVVPYYTFHVADAGHIFTFVMMFAIGLVISELTLRARRQERRARSREARTAALYALSRDLASALDRDQAAETIAAHAAPDIGDSAIVLLPGADGGLAVAARAGRDLELDEARIAAARWALHHGRAAGTTTDTHPGAGVLCIPLAAGDPPHGVLVLDAAGAGRSARAEQRHFVDAFVRQSALALERAHLADAAKAAALRARSEEMRSALLSAVSHDLRTPLAAITGAATTLLDRQAASGDQRELLVAVCEEAERMERLVANLLDMTRLEAGPIEVVREWVPLEEVVGAALGRLDRQLEGRRVELDLPPELPLISVDPVLLQQVFVNLVDNATKYTPPGTPISIAARPGAGAIEIDVADRGDGLAPGDETRLFEKFARGRSAVGHGVGLGLSICRGIVEVHGGAISASNRPGGGAQFRLSLPLVGPPPPLALEEEAAS